MAKNKQIEKYLNQAENKRNYNEGVNLYLDFTINPVLRNKFVIGGEKASNRKLLFVELESLVKIDPDVIEKHKKEVRLEKEKQDTLKEFNELKSILLTHIANRDIEAARNVFEEILKYTDCENEIEYITESIKNLESDLEDELQEGNKLANLETELEEANEKLFKASAELGELTDLLKEFSLPLEPGDLKAAITKLNEKLEAQITAATQTSEKLVNTEKALSIALDLLKENSIDCKNIDEALKATEKIESKPAQKVDEKKTTAKKTK